ncbi:dihydrolipoyl dehydrogenase [Terasakiispira papahanaumokuakeensis]|uniref:Dihydrolipoyl dehydrogenase n=1 Tax=Terasakiispira papahanaumokuakeensis TaxID=197479 RepID=A0A1E2V6Y9_9GAMM|nr:dihydrolipoyl dehydrogenase [Terasakiispira papahanaumokuakeensis]ODC02751.1 dihydrolipoyl dehydrogenase [Terasakiispira papahanaumokuakeensis]
MQSLQVDVAILGSGTAGLSAYRAATQAGKRAVMIENGPYGTTCARVGCMPSKLLIAAAESAQHIRESAPFGVHSSSPEINGREVMDRVRRERDRFVNFVIDDIESFPEADRLRGHARFIEPHLIQVDDHTQVRAANMVIATGSRPNVPAPFQAAGDRLVINDDVFEWDELPQSVAVFGPGVIGLELGQALHRLGVNIRLFGRGGLVGPLQDEAIRQYAEHTFAEEFPLHADAQVEDIRREQDQVVIRFYHPDRARVIEERFDYLLAATGRRPNVDQLNIEAAGLKLDTQGVPEFDSSTLQCVNQDGTPSHIFISGDANNDKPLLHEASDEGRIAGHNAAHFPQVNPGHRRTPISVVFSDPQLAMAGETLPQLKQRLSESQLAIGEVSFENQGRSRVMRINKGLLRVYADKSTGQLLGMEMVGPRAEHIAHLLAWSIQQQLTIKQLLEMPFYHPVIEEGVRTALRDVAHQLIQ